MKLTHLKMYNEWSKKQQKQQQQQRNILLTSLNSSKPTPPKHLSKETGRFDTNSSSEITQKIRSL